jgi:hypothetical protein
MGGEADPALAAAMLGSGSTGQRGSRRNHAAASLVSSYGGHEWATLWLAALEASPARGYYGDGRFGRRLRLVDRAGALDFAGTGRRRTRISASR